MAKLIDVNLKDIQRDPQQPRKDFNQEALQELADSIKARGVMQAITIRRTPEEIGGTPYIIIAGERRWRASNLAEMNTIPCILKDGEEADVDTIRAQQLTENLFREDLNPVEKAEFIQTRINELKAANISDAVTQVAGELGVSNSWISKSTAILKVSEDIRGLARIGKIRDYSIVKKIDKLKGGKRDIAIAEIQQGSFNAKEFFKRKRYEKPTANTAVITSDVNDSQIRKTSRKRIRAVSFNINETIELIKKTDFLYVLEESDPNWRQNDHLMEEYFDKFKEWVTRCDEEMMEGELEIESSPG